MIILHNLISTLNTKDVITYHLSEKMLFEQIKSTNADIDCSNPHISTKKEEIAMVEMTHTIIQPCCFLLRNNS